MNLTRFRKNLQQTNCMNISPIFYTLVSVCKDIAVAYRGGCGVFKPPSPSEIPKALQNRAKINPIVKTVKNC
jgi:hypothetical protein